MDLKDAEAKWRELHHQAVAAEEAARAVEREVTFAFRECAAGRGPAPAEGVLTRAEALRKEADRCRNVETGYLKGVFG
jgi:hypothetical protein